jgi:SAM-dependent methyltransferase
MIAGIRQTPFSVNWLVHRLARQQIDSTVRACAAGWILDVGCGERPYDDILAQVSNARVGLEVDRQRYGANAPDVWGSGAFLPFANESFDTVVSFQVLEHLAEPQQVVHEISRVLKPGGRLVLTAPHIWGIHEEPHDYFRYTGFGLSHLSHSAGLKVSSVKAMAGYWVTAGARFCYYLQHFEKLGLSLLVRPMYAVVQVTALVLDRLHRVESDAWNFILVAVKDVDSGPGRSR